jgi:hypothetical protein
MPVSQLPQAPYRQDRKIFPTPLTTDVLFSEVRDCTRSEFPEYGTPHPNAAKWPYHKLIFIKTVDIERDGVFEFFYAADRENQDLYNFASGFRNIIGNVGGREFRVVLRQYVTPRADFDPALPEFGSAMPDVPQDTFDGVSYVFFDKQQQKIEQPELDSLYVQETHTYVETAFLDYKLSYLTQVPDLVPDKYRSSLPRTTTEEIVEGIAVSPTLAANELQASQDQLNPNVKLVKSVIQPKPTTDVVLLGKRNYVESTKANTVETYSSGILTPDSGFLVAQSVVTPTGDGSSIKETVSVDAWPTLVSSEWDELLSVQVVSTEQFVKPVDVNTGLAHTSYKAVNEDRTLKTSYTPPTSALSGYMLAVPSQMDIPLPDVLKSVRVIWTKDLSVGFSDGEWNGYSSGTSISLSGAEGDQAQSSGSVTPQVVLDIEQPSGSNTPVTIYAFFLPIVNGQVTANDILTRTNSQRWPKFRPIGHTIVAQGMKASVVAGASGSASASWSDGGVNNSQERGTTKKREFDVNTTVTVINVPPTIHGLLSIGQATETLAISASAEASWTGYNFPSLSVTSNANKTITGAVNPATFPVTSPASIPTSGKYLIQSSVEPFKYGWAKCTAVVLDAADLN